MSSQQKGLHTSLPFLLESARTPIFVLNCFLSWAYAKAVSQAACISPIGPPVSTSRSRSRPEKKNIDSLVHLPQDVSFRNFAVFKDKLTGSRATNAQFVQHWT